MARPWTTLESVATPDGPLELRRRGERDFLMTIAGRVLMTSTAHRSEDALARLACVGLSERRGVRALVGGLGMGFMLRAALDVLAPDAHVTTVELNEVVARWCRGPLAGLTDHALDDRRASLVLDDVARVLARTATGPASARFDAIMIDLYEGPPSRIPAAHPLYGPGPTANAFRALRAGGRYAVWCEQRSPAFERFLGRAGFAVELTRAGKGARIHPLYLATRP